MTIRRFSLFLIVVISLSAAVTSVLFWKLTSVIAELSDVRDKQYISSQLAQEISTTSRSLTAAVRAYAVTGDVAYENVYNELVAITSGTAPRPITSSVAPGEAIPRTDLLPACGLTPDELGKLIESAGLSKSLIELEVEAMHLVKGIFKDDKGQYTIKKSPDREQAIQLVYGQAYKDSVVRIMRPHDDFYAMMEARITAEVTRIEATVQMFTWLAAGAIAMMLALSLTMAVYMYKGISLKLADTARFAESVAQGNLDLTSPVESCNEIGVLRASLNTMTSTLRARILEATENLQQATIKEQEACEAMLKADAASAEAENKNQNLLLAAEKLEGVARIVSSTAVQLNAQLGESENNATLQATRIAETATAMEEMNSSVLEVSHNASEAAKVSAQTRLKAETSAQEVSQVIVSVQRTQQEALALKGIMSELETRAQDISQIMSVISDIADQTNLLALNAAIEAARAGDAGRGFAVVADEVRKLAEKTMSSTTDVGNAIKSIQESATQSAQQVDKAVSSIEAVTGDIQLAGGSLQEIVALVDTTADQVRGIAAASEEQSATSDEINRALLEVNSLADNTVLAMKESTQAVNALSHQAQGLSQLIDDMKKN